MIIRYSDYIRILIYSTTAAIIYYLLEPLTMHFFPLYSYENPLPNLYDPLMRIQNIITPTIMILIFSALNICLYTTMRHYKIKKSELITLYAVILLIILHVIFVNISFLNLFHYVNFPISYSISYLLCRWKKEKII
jgi:hypothetical protein